MPELQSPLQRSSSSAPQTAGLDQLPASGGNNKRAPWVAGAALAFLMIAVVGGVWAYTSWQPQPEKSVPVAKPSMKIGLMMPFSGGSSASGVGALKGVNLAKKHLAADNIEIVQVDSKCDPEAAKEAMSQLVAQRVVAVIGEACSTASLAALPLANSNKIPLISPSASSSQLSIAEDYFFRVVPADEVQGKFTAQFIMGKGQKKVAILHSDEAYGTSLTKVFREEYEALGGTVAAVATFPSDETNLSRQVTNLKAAKPDAIYLISNSSPSAVAALQQIREAAIDAPIYGSDAINDKLILDGAKSAGEGLIVVCFSEGNQDFQQALAAEYPEDELTFAAAEAYDAFRSLHVALEAGALDGQAIKSKLMKLDLQGASGRIKFNVNGEVTEAEHQYAVLQAQGGTFKAIQ